MVRQKDIAKALNISRTTVARAFAGKNISEDTREKVFAMAKEMGYVHNSTATILSLKTNKVVYCFIIATIDEGYAVHMADGIQEVTRIWNGYNFELRIVFTDIKEKGNQAENQIEQFNAVMKNERVDGVIFSALSRENLEYVQAYCQERKIPLMTLDLIYKDTSLCHIGPSYYNLGAASAAYLAEIMRGEGRILTLYYDDGYELSKERMKGFHERLKDYPDIEQQCIEVDGIDCATYEKVLREKVPAFHPTAIYAPYKMDNIILALEKMGDTTKYRMISNGINDRIEQYLFDGTITGIVTTRPFHLGAVAANNFFKYFYRGSEMLRDEVDVGLNIYMRENYERFHNIF